MHASRELGPGDLVLCAGTLLGASFQDLLAAATAGAFQGITLWPDVYRRAVVAGLTLLEMSSILDDRGLVVSDLDPLLGSTTRPKRPRGISLPRPSRVGSSRALGRSRCVRS